MKNYIPILLLIGLLSCSTVPTSETVILLDNTETREASLTDEALFALVGNAEQVQVRLSEITDQSVVRTVSVHKKPMPPFWFRVEREVAQNKGAFKQEFFDALAQFPSPEKDRSYSYVYQSLATQLIHLSKRSADHKKVIVKGDMLHHTKSFSFYRYRRRPLNIRADYEQIVQQLENSEPEMREVDLSGIHIQVVYLPKKKDDALFSAVRSFWIQYFQSKNAEISFSTNIENL